MIARRSLLAGAAAPLLARPALAQILPGGRPMRWVVPFPPGGAGDAIGRIWADAFTTRNSQPVVIENRGGANGLLGIEAVTRAAPDGATLGVFNISFYTALPLMTKVSYDPARDLTPISKLVTSTVLCCVTAERARQRGWTDFRSLVEWARKPGNQLTKGSASNGGPAHLLIATIAKRSGADILHVPYRGGAPALNDLLSGNIDMVFDFMPALLPQVAAGKLIPLAVGSAARSPLLPDVPGLGEFADLGLGGLDLQSWNILTGPGGMAPETVETIAGAVRRSQDAPGLKEKLATAGLVLAVSESRPELMAAIAADGPRWREMIEVSGARIE